MRWITPFAWEDDAGALHLVPQRILATVGLPPTAENIELATVRLIEALRVACPGSTILIVESPDARTPPRPAAQYLAERGG